MTRIKLLIVTTRFAPYREPLYKLLDSEFDCFWVLTQDTHENINNTFLKDKDNYYLPKKIKFKNLVPLTFIFFKLLIIRFDYCLSLPAIYPECWQAFLIVKLKRKKIILWDEEYIGEKSIKRKFIMPLTNFINRNSDYVLVPTIIHKDYQKSKGVKEGKIILFSNVTNIDGNYNKSNVLEIINNYNLDNKKVILYSGRLIKLKGVQYLIEAYYKLLIENEQYKNDTVLIIIGDGDYKDELIDLSKKILKIGGNVNFLGNIDNKYLNNYYYISYIGVIPSINYLGRSDSCPLVFNEFGLYGKPVIVSNMVGASGFIKHYNELGFVVNEKSSEVIKEKMKFYLDINENEYNLLSSSIVDITKGYNDYEMCLNIIKTLVN